VEDDAALPVQGWRFEETVLTVAVEEDALALADHHRGVLGWGGSVLVLELDAFAVVVVDDEVGVGSIDVDVDLLARDAFLDLLLHFQAWWLHVNFTVGLVERGIMEDPFSSAFRADRAQLAPETEVQQDGLILSITCIVEHHLIVLVQALQLLAFVAALEIEDEPLLLQQLTLLQLFDFLLLLRGLLDDHEDLPNDTLHNRQEDQLHHHVEGYEVKHHGYKVVELVRVVVQNLVPLGLEGDL
jgi:hypothetical protein